MSLGQCQPLFQELLLLLQPLSVLPFDLNLLLEPRLLHNRQLCSEEEGASPPPPCSALLLTSWPLLQADKKVEGSHSGHPDKSSQRRILDHQESLSSRKQECEEMQASRSPVVAPVPERWPVENNLTDGVFEEKDCSQNNLDNWSQISMYSGQEESRGEKDNESPDASTRVQAESPCQGWLRWAKLFGAADTSTRTETVPQNDAGAQTRR